MSELKFEVHIDKSELVRFLKDYKRSKDTDADPTIFQPVRFGFTTDYAESLEYGTGPLRLKQMNVHGGDYTYDTIHQEIDAWAKRKLGMVEASERDPFVDAVTNRMWFKGMYPHPYFRPALQWIEDNIQNLINSGWSLYEIADEALSLSDYIIQMKGMPDLGNLQGSATVNSLTFDEIAYRTNERVNDEDKRNRFETGVKKIGGWE